jgi:hypothetical protein
MSARLIVGVVALAGISICGLVVTLANAEMVEKVNDRLPKELHFSPLGWYWSKTRRLHREYRKIYRDGNLLWKVRIALFLAFSCMLACTWALGFFAI